MYLISYGTRPELLKVLPLINEFILNNIEFQTLFTNQHETLIKEYEHLIIPPTYVLKNIMKRGQSLEMLTANIISQCSDLFKSQQQLSKVIVQGDTTSAFAVALSAFYNKKQIIHVEAGLRTHNIYSPYPEEVNRQLISKLSNIHFCPTNLAAVNLKNENIFDNVFIVGNTIVDTYKYILKTRKPDSNINNILQKKYILVTLHRRENRGDKIRSMWNQLNTISDTHCIVYIKHPSIPECTQFLNENIILLEPQKYTDMVHLINQCTGIISDSGGLQEEAICANKLILICRNDTERPETITYGNGKLIGDKILENIEFFNSETLTNNINNPYGKNVCKQILNYLNNC